MSARNQPLWRKAWRNVKMAAISMVSMSMKTENQYQPEIKNIWRKWQSRESEINQLQSVNKGEAEMNVVIINGIREMKENGVMA